MGCTNFPLLGIFWNYCVVFPSKFLSCILKFINTKHICSKSLSDNLLIFLFDISHSVLMASNSSSSFSSIINPTKNFLSQYRTECHFDLAKKKEKLIPINSNAPFWGYRSLYVCVCFNDGKNLTGGLKVTTSLKSPL